MRPKPFITLAIGIVAISFASIFIRIAEAPPLVIATYRLIIASAVLLPFAVRKLRALKLSQRDVKLIILSSIFLAIHFGLWITSLSLTTIASSVVLVTSHPAFVALISYFLWKEKPSKATLSEIALAMIGIFLVNYRGFSVGLKSLMGNIMALVGGLAAGLYLIIGRELRARIDALSYLTIIYSFSGMILLFTSLFARHSFLGYSAQTYVMFFLLGLVPQLIGHSCLNIAVRALPVTLVSVSILGEPMGATLLAIFFLKEIPKTLEICGGLLIIFGIYLVSRGVDTNTHH